MPHRRRIYLINPKFQLKFSIYICLILCLSSLVYPFAIYEIMTKFIGFASQQAPNFSQELEGQRKALILILILWQFGFTSLVFIICIFIGHKIAGPIYKVQKYLSSVREGKSRDKIQFRSGDYFQELSTEINKTFDSIQESYARDFSYLNEVITYLNNLSIVVPEDKKVVIEEIKQKLSEIQGRFKNK